MSPLLDQMLRQHLRAENIRFAQIGNCLKVLYPQPQVIELPTREIKQTQCQARGQYLLLHHVVTHQLEFSAVPEARLNRRCGSKLRLRPRAGSGLNPGGPTFLERLPGIASLLHVACVPGLVHQACQSVLQRLGQRGQYPHGTLRE